MIKLDGIVKHFGDFAALSGISCEIQDGCIYGLVGINGAGKSTLLRIITGIYEADEGTVTFDGESLAMHPELKADFAFVPDELFLPNNSNLLAMSRKYRRLYNGRFNDKIFFELASEFSLDVRKPFNGFSKGMRRQAATILALSLETKYIFFDETFDGLDPFKRSYVKKLITEDVKSRGATAIITSHSLKELEDICDKLAVLEKGGLVFESDLSDVDGVVRVQVAFSEDYDETKFSSLDVLDFNKLGAVATLTVKGEAEEIKRVIEEMSPILFEMLPMSFEDVFNFELSQRGVKTVFGEEAKG